jgi:hypothetical protein
MLPAGRLLADGALRNRRRSLSRHFFLPPLFLSGGVIVGDVAGPVRFVGEVADSFTPPASSSLLTMPSGEGALAALSRAAANGSKSALPCPTARAPSSCSS